MRFAYRETFVETRKRNVARSPPQICSRMWSVVDVQLLYGFPIFLCFTHEKETVGSAV